MSICLTVLILLTALLSISAAPPGTFLLDDFSREGVSALGTSWQTFTDRVMGGVSDGQAAFETLDGRRCLRLRGRVSLENQGGFVQTALPLAKEGGSLEVSAFKGIRLLVKGNGHKYYIHLRTDDTRLPWQYYAAGFDAGPDWASVDIPFSAFEPENLRPALDTRKLRRLAIVAAKKAFAADVAVAKIEFYQ